MLDFVPKSCRMMQLGDHRQVIRLHTDFKIQSLWKEKNTTFLGHIILFAAIKQVYFCIELPLYCPQSARQHFMELRVIGGKLGDTIKR